MTGWLLPVATSNAQMSWFSFRSEGLRTTIRALHTVAVRPDEREAQQVTSAGDTRFPIWTADGQWITYSAGAGGIPNLFWTRVGERGSPDRIASSEPV